MSYFERLKYSLLIFLPYHYIVTGGVNSSHFDIKVFLFVCFFGKKATFC